MVKNGINKKYDRFGNVLYELIDGKGHIKDFDSLVNLIKEGEYIDGELKKAKEYFRQGEIIFEGEYLKGIGWKGIGKEYNFYGRLTYDGEYLNGMKLKGKKFKYFKYYNRLIFEGE